MQLSRARLKTVTSTPNQIKRAVSAAHLQKHLDGSLSEIEDGDCADLSTHMGRLSVSTVASSPHLNSITNNQSQHMATPVNMRMANDMQLYRILRSGLRVVQNVDKESSATVADIQSHGAMQDANFTKRRANSIKCTLRSTTEVILQEGCEEFESKDIRINSLHLLGMDTDDYDDDGDDNSQCNIENNCGSMPKGRLAEVVISDELVSSELVIDLSNVTRRRGIGSHCASSKVSQKGFDNQSQSFEASQINERSRCTTRSQTSVSNIIEEEELGSVTDISVVASSKVSQKGFGNQSQSFEASQISERSRYTTRSQTAVNKIIEEEELGSVTDISAVEGESDPSHNSYLSFNPDETETRYMLAENIDSLDGAESGSTFSDDSGDNNDVDANSNQEYGLISVETESFDNDDNKNTLSSLNEVNVGDTVLSEPDINLSPLASKTPRNRRVDALLPECGSFRASLTPVKSKSSGLLISWEEKVLLKCQQTRPVSFMQCIPCRMMSECVKIGEGVYGEVFRTTNQNGESVALKIVPIESDLLVNGEVQKTYEEILQEIVISLEVSQLQKSAVHRTPNFVQVNKVSCVQGAYPRKLLEEWDTFDHTNTSENDRPDSFADLQLFIVFEFGDGGSALEKFKFGNLQQARAVLQQVIYTLAIAERALEFEHRDLHWGNVLIRQCEETHVTYMVNSQQLQIPNCGVHVSIIDFTNSRLKKDDVTVHVDLASDETLFTGVGDYQFDVYRLMKQHNSDNWEEFSPYSNVLWIHYLGKKLCYEKSYREKSRDHRVAMKQMRNVIDTLTNYASAYDIICSCDYFKVTIS